MQFALLCKLFTNSFKEWQILVKRMLNANEHGKRFYSKEVKKCTRVQTFIVKDI